MSTPFQKYKLIILYGLSMALLFFLLKFLEFRYMVIDHAVEIYIGAIAIIFTGLGIWLARKLTKPKVETLIVEKEVYRAGGAFVLNEKEIEHLGISPRELEVLQLMSAGLSNQEIADKLFISLSTVKTHSAKLFEKLDVKRRTQAVEKAKRSGLIP